MIGVDGSGQRRLISDPGYEGQGSWSRDGKWIYYGCSRTGRSGLNKIPAGGGEPIEVTRTGGRFGLESPAYPEHCGIHHNPAIVLVGSKAARIHSQIMAFRNGPPRPRENRKNVSDNGGGWLCQAVMAEVLPNGRSGPISLNLLRHFDSSCEAGTRER